MPVIFVSYSHQDHQWVQNNSSAGRSGERPFIPWLADQLRDQDVELWCDPDLQRVPGADYEAHILSQIDRSDYAILLISQDFVSSDFIRRIELPRIRQRVEKGEMGLFPILVAPVRWKTNEDSRWLHSRQIIPAEPTPLINFTRDEAQWRKVRVDVLEVIAETIEGLGASTEESKLRAIRQEGASSLENPLERNTASNEADSNEFTKGESVFSDNDDLEQSLQNLLTGYGVIYSNGKAILKDGSLKHLQFICMNLGQRCEKIELNCSTESIRDEHVLELRNLPNLRELVLGGRLDLTDQFFSNILRISSLNILDMRCCRDQFKRRMTLQGLLHLSRHDNIEVVKLFPIPKRHFGESKNNPIFIHEYTQAISVLRNRMPNCIIINS